MPPRTPHLQRLETLSASQIRRSLSHSPRFVHSSSRRRHVSLQSTPPPPSQILGSNSSRPQPPPKAVLARLPTSSVLRSYLITRMSSSPALLALCFAVLRRMLESKSYLMSIERNPAIAKLLKNTFYAQFCAGETKSEARQTMTTNRELLGYDAIMLEFALEVLGGEAPTPSETSKEIETWRTGMLQSIEIAQPGDFVGLKWSGLGRAALHLLKTQQDPTPEMMAAMTAACDAAAAKNVALLPGAEEETTNIGLEKWCLDLQRKYNKSASGRAVVYTTYQCYLKGISHRLAQHLETAQKEGFVAGVKLVRGAYMTTEPRELVWESKQGTDACYDACAEAVLKREWNACVAPSAPDTPFPAVNIILATHNASSIEKAQRIRAQQLFNMAPEALPRLAYIQLLGMADELSQELVQSPANMADPQAKVVKCMTWGTTTECLNFLMRRASENKEAAMRTEDTRRAMGKELWRRLKGVFKLA